MYWGPTAVGDGVRRFEQLLREEQSDLVGSAYLTTFLGGLVAQGGDLERGASLVRSAREVLTELGQHGAVLSYCETVAGEIQLLANDGEAAEATLRRLCHHVEQRNDFSHLASRASDLAEALVMQAKLDEAFEWTLIAERHAAADDVNAQMMWPPVRARVLGRRGEFAKAIALASRGVELADATDDLNRRAEAYRDLGEVCLLADRPRDASRAYDRAIELFEQKENVVGAATVRSLSEDLALV
jgi:tetratricopeptide (TPR) repeat protein